MVEKRPKGTLNPPVVDLVSMTQGLLVAECLSFRRAARMLGTTQSVVSRRVRTLEDRLGVSLLERHRSGLRVTAAGARFFEQAREIDQQIEFAIKTAGAAGRGAIGRLNIGIVSSMAAGFLREVLRAYHAGHPDVLVHVLEGASNEQIALVRKSRLDVGFVLGTPDLPHCDVTRLWSERIYAAIPQGHLLRDRDEITWDALRREKFILCRSELGCALHDQLIRHVAQLSSRPRVERLDVGREILIHLVALGLGVSLTTEATVATQFPEVVFRPVAGDDAVIPFSAVWLPNNDNPAFRRFMSLAREMARKWKQQPRDVVPGHSGGNEKGKTIRVSHRSRVAPRNGRSRIKRRRRHDAHR